MKKMQFKTTPVLIASIALASVVYGTSCNSSQNEKVNDAMDTVAAKVDTLAADVKDKANDLKGDMEEYRDETFVKNAIESNEQELHLLALGQQKGMDKELKAHAKMMEKDHKALGAKMKAYATKQNYTLNTADTKDALDDDAKGTDWDKKWADKMVDDHQKTIDKFERAESRTNDQALKDIVSGALPTLREHLDMAKRLQEKLNK